MAEQVRKRATKDDDYDTLIALLREYTEKLNHYTDDARKSGTVFNRQVTARLLPVAHELASYASQQIEYRGYDDLTRLELQLRLAEFESALTTADKKS